MNSFVRFGLLVFAAGLFCSVTQSLVYEGFFCAYPAQTRYRLTCPGGLIRVLSIQALQTTELNCYKDLSLRPCNQRVVIPSTHIFSIQVMTRCHQRTSCELVGTNPLREIAAPCEANSTLRNMQVVVFECVQSPGSPDQPDSDHATMRLGARPTTLIPPMPDLPTIMGAIEADTTMEEVPQKTTTTPAEEEMKVEMRPNWKVVRGSRNDPADDMPKTFIIAIGLVIFILLLGLLGLIIFLYRRGILPLKINCCCCGKNLLDDDGQKSEDINTSRTGSKNELQPRSSSCSCNCPKYVCACPQPDVSRPRKILQNIFQRTTPVGSSISSAVRSLVDKVNDIRPSLELGRVDETSPRKPEIVIVPSNLVMSRSEFTARHSGMVGDRDAGEGCSTSGSADGHENKNPNLLNPPNKIVGHSRGGSVRSGRTASSFDDEDYQSDFDESEFDTDDDDEEGASEGATGDAEPAAVIPRRSKTLTEEIEYAFVKIQTQQHKKPDEEIYANCGEIMAERDSQKSTSQKSSSRGTPDQAELSELFPSDTMFPDPPIMDSNLLNATISTPEKSTPEENATQGDYDDLQVDTLNSPVVLNGATAPEVLYWPSTVSDIEIPDTDAYGDNTPPHPVYGLQMPGDGGLFSPSDIEGYTYAMTLPIKDSEPDNAS